MILKVILTLWGLKFSRQIHNPCTAKTSKNENNSFCFVYKVFVELTLCASNVKRESSSQSS
jgi:hypothetical protein